MTHKSSPTALKVLLLAVLLSATFITGCGDNKKSTDGGSPVDSGDTRPGVPGNKSGLDSGDTRPGVPGNRVDSSQTVPAN
jgi:hypothetical protein